MKIYKNKRYNIVGYVCWATGEVGVAHYGEYDGADVRLIIGNAKWDDLCKMFFSDDGKHGFDLQEVNAE